MKDRLSGIKMKLYCFVVNRNAYVRDAYQLPVDLDMEYHRRHRIRELARLAKLLVKYRILRRKPSGEELSKLREMQEKRSQLLQEQAGMISVQRDDAEEIRKAVTEAVNEIRGADLLRFPERENIIIWGNGAGSEVPQLVRKITGSSDGAVNKYRFIWLRNKKKTEEILTLTTLYYPLALMPESGYPEGRSISLAEEELRALSGYAFLRQAADLMLDECPQMDETYAELISHETGRYFSAVLEYLKPRLVLVWNESAWFSLISKTYCDECGIPYALLGLVLHPV